jgi:hypothetical protein
MNAPTAAQPEKTEPGIVADDDSSRVAQKPSDFIWDNLKIGEVVLAAELDEKGAPLGWYEATIVHISGDQFHTRWPDYPDEEQPKRARRHIALLHSLA